MFGEPITDSMIDSYLDNLFSNDATLMGYAPGGAHADRPDDKTARPVVQWWLRYSHPDTISQTVTASRAQSNPEYVIAMVDVQNAGQVDYKYGAAGMRQRPALAYMELGTKRIYELLHNRTRTINGVDYTTICNPNLRGRENTTTGNYDVWTGWRVQFRIT